MAEDLVERVISFFSGDNTESLSDKEVVLRERLKELTENKYAKFFRPKTDEADASLGQFFHTLYKMILPIRNFMQDPAKVTRLRQIVLEAFMDAGILELAKQLNPAVIGENAKTVSPAELITRVRADIGKFRAGFDENRKNRINRCYNMIMVFFQLAHFDYPAILKKFDPNFIEGPFSGDPKFIPVKSSVVAKDIGEFLAVSRNISPDNDWKTLLKLLKSCAGEDLISESQFVQILIGLRDIINSKMLELIVQYGSKNPVWACKPLIPDEHIAEGWLEARINKAQEYINKVIENEKDKQIGTLLANIFVHDDLERLENYTAAKGEVYRKRELAYFTYALGTNYLEVFLADYLEKEIHELCDIVLIRGQWTNNVFAKEMSEALHQLLELPEEITNFDETLSEDGSEGSRLKAALIRIDRDRTQARYINSIMDGVNEAALEILNEAIQHLSVIEKHLKNLAADVQKKYPEMITNWRELNQFSKDPLTQRIIDDSNKIECFVQLMNLCIQ
ncbi:MAG: DUF5312 family protein [Treponema sp.]|jgi:hypothetical protein|nr:DUF5312 family protein [Treponema sp.]